MSHHHAFGLMLVALAVASYFCVGQIWARTRQDPQWVLRGEFRDLLSPAAIQVVNALLVVTGAVCGTASFLFGLFLLRWF